MARRVRSIVFAIIALGLASAPGCYEIPPRIPDDYTETSAEGIGWPPLPVYDADPFHLANRLFQRVWILGAEPISGDVPLATRADLDAVDEAEMLLIFDMLGSREESSREKLSPRGRRLLVADLDFLAGRWTKDPRPRERSLAHRLAQLSAALESSASLPELPRPGTGVFDPEVLPTGHPRPSGSELESWGLDAQTKRARVLVLRRQRWLATGSHASWEELGEDANLAVNGAAESGLVVGTRGELCGGCHGS